MKKALPMGWKVLPLEDVCRVEMGQSPPSSTYNSEGMGLPFFQGKTEFGQLYPTVRKWCSRPNKTAGEGDILVSVRAPVGPTNLAPGECCIGRGLAALRPRNGTLSKFLLYQLRLLEGDLDRLGTGTTFRAISGKVLRGFPVRWAPGEVQREIVDKIEEIFPRLEAAVAALRRVEAKLVRYRAAVLRAAVEGRLSEQWRLDGGCSDPASKAVTKALARRRGRAAGSRSEHEPQAPLISAFSPPPSWAMLDLASVVAEDAPIVYGILQPGPHLPGGVPYVRPTEIQNDRIALGEVRRTSQAIARRYARSMLRENDVVLSIVGTIGKVAVVPPELDGGNLTQSSARVRPDAEIALPDYLAIALRSPTLRVQYDAMRLGTAVPRLNLAHVRDLMIPLPPMEEQREIVAVTGRVMSLIDRVQIAVEAAIARSDALRQAALAKAFTGELCGREERIR